jgi:hypothetical protein
MAETLLQVRHLEVNFATRQGVITPYEASPLRLTPMKRWALLASQAAVKASPPRP